MNALDKLAKNELISTEQLKTRFLRYLNDLWGRGDARNLTTKRSLLEPHWDLQGSTLRCAWRPLLNASEVLGKILSASEDQIRKTLLGSKEAYLDLARLFKQSLTEWSKDLTNWHIRMDIARSHNPLGFVEIQNQYFDHINRQSPTKFILHPEHIRTTHLTVKVESPLLQGEVQGEILLRPYQERSLTSHYLHETKSPKDVFALLDVIPDAGSLGSTRWRIKQSKQAKAHAKNLVGMKMNLSHLTEKVKTYREFLANEQIKTEKLVREAAGKKEKNHLVTQQKQLRAAEQDVFGWEVVLGMASDLSKGSKDE